MRESTRVKSYNHVISLTARNWAHLILAVANGSFWERVALRLPTGFRPGGFSFFGVEVSIFNKFSDQHNCTLRCTGGANGFFLAGPAYPIGVAPVYSFFQYRFIHNQKNG